MNKPHLPAEQVAILELRKQEHENYVAKVEADQEDLKRRGIEALYDFWICFSTTSETLEEWLERKPMTNEEAQDFNKVLHEAVALDMKDGD